MQKIKLFLLLFVASNSFGQSDGCTNATPISVTANCSSPVSGTTLGATQTIAGCSGNADDDVWYSFVATNTIHQIVVTPSAGMDPVLQLLSGGCGSLVSLICKDDYASGTAETINYSGLTIGVTYTIRIYHYGSGAGTGDFTLCVTNPPPSPSNDACANAIPLGVNTTCVSTLGSGNGATQSLAGCSGTADDDVWFSFVATNALQSITVDPIDNIDPVVQVYGGSCGSLNSIICVDNTFTAQNEQFDVVGLTPGQTYYVRVYDYYTGATGDFNICVVGDPTPAPSNDEPCNAIQLPNVSATCQFSEFTTVGSTAYMGAPTPSTCAGGGGAAIGGFSSSSHDVWFAITVPSSGNIHITAKPNMGAGSITDGVMALYSGTCGSLSQIACSDDNNYPGSGNDLLPLISASGLTPGQTVYLRYWGFGTSQGTFGICVTTATNDNCANALYICDINGYSASTSGAYTPDRPDNMRGNNEDINGTNMPDGTNTGGVFGQGGSWGTGAPAFDVTIDNNSWIKFTASAATATLQVSIYDCWIGNYPSGGIQMQIFQANNCTNFTPVSNFEESSTGFTITANNLTIGNDYYLMVDGFAGDICNYTITAESGVQFPDLEEVAPICPGESVVLTAPPGATSYSWAHDGSTTQTVSVTPSTTQTYLCEVTGLCDYKQTLDVQVVVKPLPDVQIANGVSTSICSGQSVNLTATGATSYLWNTTQTNTTINVSPTTNTTYSVTGTLDGCTDDATINVVVNSLPSLTVAPTSSPSDCGAANGSLSGTVVSGAPTLGYSWTNGGGTQVGTTINLTNIPAGVYYLDVTDGNSCSNTFGPYNVINPGAPSAPTINTSDVTPCLDGTVTLTASHSNGSATFDWTGPSGFSSSNSTFTLDPVQAINQGNYCVTATVSGCTGPATCEFITVLNPPSITIDALNNDTTICANDDATLTATGGVSYSWSGPDGFNANSPTVTISNMTLNQEGYYTVNVTDNEGCMNTDSILVSYLTLPSVSMTADNANNTYCGGGIATLTASGATDYSWTGPNGFNSSGNSSVIFDLTASNEGWYYLTGTDTENCSAMDSVYLDIVTDVPALAEGDSIVCPGEDASFSGSGGEAFVWTGPQSLYTEEPNFTLFSSDFDNTGWYYLTSIDSNGCIGYDSTYLSVEPNAGCLVIPELVTPDGDILNDTWEIVGLSKFENAEVEIYNRWGNLIYAASPYEQPWDGSVNKGTTIDNNGKVPTGTYFYIIRLNDNETAPFKGYIEVQY